MVSRSRWTGGLFILLATLTATALQNAPAPTAGAVHSHKKIAANKSRKRQEIIFLRDDLTRKRNREEDTMANIEKHGKSVTAEGYVFKGGPITYNYDDSPGYQGPALKGQSVKKDHGPPEIQENQKKSDAYEVVSENGDSKNTDTVSDGDDQELKVVKVEHPRVRAHDYGRHSSHYRGHHKSGLHIVSIDDNDETNDKDYDEKISRDKDLRLYGSIGSPSPNSVGHESRKIHHSIYHDEFLPSNIVSLSQDDFAGPLLRGAGHSTEEFFPSFKRRDSLLFSEPSQLQQTEEIMQQQFAPVNPKSMSFGERPDMLLLPIYNGYAGTSPTVVPFTTRRTFPSSMSQLASAPIDYSPSSSTANLGNGLSLEPAFQVPQVQTPSVSSPYILPSETEEEILFNNQQPDIRSLYSLQAQSQIQIPQSNFPHLEQPQQPIISSGMQMNPSILSLVGQREVGPAHRWVDEDGRQRSEVLDRGTEGQDDNRSHDDGNEGDHDEDDEDDERDPNSRYPGKGDSPSPDEGDERYPNSRYPGKGDSPSPDEGDERYPNSRYPGKGDSPSPDEGDDDGAEENLSEEDSEDDDEADEETSNYFNDRMYGSKETGDYRGPDAQPTEQNDEDEDEEEDPEPSQGLSPHAKIRPSKYNLAARFMASSRYFPRFPPPPETSNLMAAQAFSRYQLMSPSSALKENILPKPVENPKPSSSLPNANSDLKISQMSPAEAQFYENKVAMEPNFTPSIASKDTIPGKSRRFRVGLGKVLIRLNGKPLEDSSQLRSKIENGQIIQGKGKLIKSKGPVRVKLSHTKDSKHLKIIDIIAPKQYEVYDTKSKIRTPINST
ncbi:uncharacterized protein LOC111338389 isoform X2 [Stylophora pistillata]|uniref:uncharacterized protein LOC111338389 isoform X2 n=1 Tax=Stylophora pistillata TaxID=50429 RepID=UPI000C04F65F|nr:uncharacterized protein LOC111338389 isoform X2 [Stylophora pistillata]